MKDIMQSKDIMRSAEFKGLESKAYRYKWNNRNWSDWGLLFRFLIVICKLLASQNMRKQSSKRKPNAWSTFFGQQLSQGKTMKEAAELWKNKSNN